MTNVYKVTVLVVDHDGLGPAGIKTVLENTRHPNRCVMPEVMGFEARAVEWDDAHPLNREDTMADEFARMFGEDGK